MTSDIDSVLSSSEVIPDDVTTDVPPENEQDDATQVSDEFQKLELQEAKNALRYRRWFMWWGVGRGLILHHSIRYYRGKLVLVWRISGDGQRTDSFHRESRR